MARNVEILSQCRILGTNFITMIFVTLGTQRDQFVRFLKAVDELILAYDLKDEFVVQRGHTSFSSEKFRTVDFLSETDFLLTMAQADIIITHAGYGSLFKAIKTGKKIVSMPRLRRYEEIIDDHQLDLLEKLSTEGYIIAAKESLVEIWPKVEQFQPRKYDFKNCIIENLEHYLDSLI